MAKIVEILETERKRPTAADFDVVHMYKTGQFYTAYDWSAWIISVISYTDAVRMQTKDRHPLAVTRIKIATDSLRTMAMHKVGMTDDVPIPSGVILTKSTTWADIRDFYFILWLTEQIVTLDPMENCIIVGDGSDWDGMDHAKCMRYVQSGLGLPIGNLTSQLYSNVYLNPFDQFVKRDILCEYYGRYVDDSAMIDACREWLLEQVPKVREFLADELGLQLHMGKLHVREVSQGIEFLGAFVKPYRDYISNKTLARIEQNVKTIDLRDIDHAEASINSMLGVMSHFDAHRLSRELFCVEPFLKHGYFADDMTCYYLHR